MKASRKCILILQSTPQIAPSGIRTEAVTFNSGIHRATERDRGDNRPRPPTILGGLKLGSSPRGGGPAFLLALLLALVIVVAMSALPANCEEAATAAAVDRSDLGEAPSRPPRMLTSRPRQPRLTKEWRQERRRQVKHMEGENVEASYRYSALNEF